MNNSPLVTDEDVSRVWAVLMNSGLKYIPKAFSPEALVFYLASLRKHGVTREELDAALETAATEFEDYPPFSRMLDLCQLYRANNFHHIGLEVWTDGKPRLRLIQVRNGTSPEQIEALKMAEAKALGMTYVPAPPKALNATNETDTQDGGEVTDLAKRFKGALSRGHAVQKTG